MSSTEPASVGEGCKVLFAYADCLLSQNIKPLQRRRIKAQSITSMYILHPPARMPLIRGTEGLTYHNGWLGLGEKNIFCSSVSERIAEAELHWPA